MFSNSLTVTYDAEAVTLNRVDFGDYAGLFVGDLANGNVLTMEISHRIPNGKVTQESHLAKLTLDQYETINGVKTYVRTSQSHRVLKTTFGLEDDTVSLNLDKALTGFLTDANIGILLDRRA